MVDPIGEVVLVAEKQKGSLDRSPPAVNSTVTLLFTDIVGSMSQAAALGDAAWAAALRDHNRAIREQVEAHGGREVKHTGDGFMIAFSSARDGVACAVAIVGALRDAALSVRVGVHTGEAVEEGDDYIGHHVNVAARIMQAAQANEVLVSAVVRQLVTGLHGIDFGPERHVPVRGLTEPYAVFPAVATSRGSLSVGILGPLQLEWRSRPVSVSAPKERAVLALLAAAAGATVPTDRLLDELWPDLEPARAKAALQVRISSLRKVFDGGADQPICSDPHGYRLNVEPDQLDAARFETLVREARAATARGDDERAASTFDVALSLWRGAALADAGSSPALEAEASRLDEARLAAIEDRLEADLACARHREVAEQAESLVALHPLRERLWAALIVALYRGGRQADALAAYQRLRESLVDELGIDPSPQLRALEAAVLAQDPALDAPGRPRAASADAAEPFELPAAVHRARVTVLVGRDDELARLMDAWHRATDGSGGAVLVVGEAGIGKTRLVSELALGAQRAGALVLLGRCDEDPLAPYQPIHQVLSAAWRAHPEAVREVEPHHLASMARLLPELRALVPDRTVDAPADDDRYSLFESTASVLRAVAARQPILVIIDDLQWIDQSSLQLLRHLVTQPIATPLLLAVTSRLDTAEAAGLVSQLSADVDRAGRPVLAVELGGLRESDLAEVASSLVADRGDAELDSSLVAALHAATRGNPFFARETIRHLLETGTVSTGRVLAVPDTVRAVIERRLDVLPDGTRPVLEAAAIVGSDFDLGLLAAVTELDPSAVLDALDPALDARLIVETSDADAFTFAHPVIRQTLDAGTARGRARRLHAAIARALERRSAAGAPDQLIAVAFHLEAAGPIVSPELLHERAAAAARHAMDILAYEDARRLFDVALRTADAADVPAGDRIELRIGLGEALVQSGDPEGRHVLAQAGDLARHHGTPEQLARAVFAASQESVAIAYADPVFIQMLEDALEGIGPDDSPLRARVLGRLGLELFQHDTGQRPADLIDEAVAVARRTDDPATLAVVLGHRRFYIYGPAATGADGAEVVALAERVGDPVLALPGHVSLASARLQQGDLHAATATVAFVEREATQLRRPRMQWWAAHARGVLASVAGDLDASDRLLAEALTLGQRTGELNAMGFYLSQAFPNARLRGVLGLVEPFVTDYVTSTPGSMLAIVALPLVHWHAGNAELAAEKLHGIAAEGFVSLRRDSTWPACVGALAEGVCALQHRGFAAELYDLLAPLSGCLVDISAVSGCYGPVDRVLGNLAAVDDDLDRAITHLEASVETCLRVPTPPWLAVSQHDLAKVLARRGTVDDNARATSLRESAQETATVLGVALD